uniref:Lipoprotein n=1 Tax=uncultured marine group II/III euryarchaeote AD1000_65_H04 TaxID=1457796 RepID=A0A075FVW0_9EURY|nr:lipoprotein [uncultured marine group II/III euryarchaeote AD1000_65_H04]
MQKLKYEERVIESMRSVLVVFILVFSLGFTGCTDSGPLDIGDALSGCPNVVGPSPPEPAIISFSGNNDTITPMFNLGQLLLKFHANHEGDGHFSIVIYGTEDEYLELVFNEIGLFDSQVYVSLDLALFSFETFDHTPGLSQDFFLEVSANGPWTIDIFQPRFTTGLDEPLTISGTGTTASEAILLDCGLKTVTVNHAGEGHFSVVIYDIAGEYIDLLANEIGTYSGSTILDIDSKGLYVLDISADADANWDVSIGEIASNSSNTENETA